MKVLAVLSQKVLPSGKALGRSLKQPVSFVLKETQKPMIANLKGYYPSAEAKLNDILLDRLEQKRPTSVVEHNIAEFNRLPESIKDSIKPGDIYRDGHISQTKMNQVWEAAKEARRPGVYGRPPVFRGEEFPEASAVTETYPQSLADTNLPELNIDLAVGEIDALADSVLETATNVADSEISVLAENVLEYNEENAELLNSIIDILS